MFLLSIDSHELYNHHLPIKIIIYLLNIFPCLQHPKPSPKPSPEPSPEKSPAHSTGGEETDGSLTEHSFYNLASDKEPTKKKRQGKKTPPKDKSPAHRSTTISPLLLPHPCQTPPLQAHLGMIQSPMS
ncbi:hypothetical protein DSO57_1037412 [Entomophthora muscae]|uniref:Uncharacterized protein n=1 Tax=Entomophthora muscae TaxID=34485 RepID=A0ACC2U8C2_9FUNG|nr:hypothetical protein DSO57_1037412 [Entomophthora muscae]